MEQAENNSPGKLLSAARIAANMSREHVAAQLHLSISVIEDLENDHYPASVNLVFIRGYLASYGKLMGIPVERLVNTLTKLGLDVLSSERSGESTIARLGTGRAVESLWQQRLRAAQGFWRRVAQAVNGKGKRLSLMVVLVVIVVWVGEYHQRHGGMRAGGKPVAARFTKVKAASSLDTRTHEASPKAVAEPEPVHAGPTDSGLTMDFTHN